METENYQIDGKKGNWIATDTIIIDGKQFYLMEHQIYRNQAQGVILDTRRFVHAFLTGKFYSVKISVTFSVTESKNF